MKRVLSLLALLMLPFAAAAQGPTISNLAVTGMTGNSVTIQWSTNVGATSQVLFGHGNLNQGTPKDFTLVTSHTATITGLTGGAIWNYAAVSTDAGGSTQSATQQFELCDANVSVGLSGSVNNYYQYGSYSVAWTNQSGYAISPTVCGQPLTQTYSGPMDSGASFSLPIPNSLEIVPSPSAWTVHATDAGNLAPVSTTTVATPPSANVTSALNSAASTAGLSNCLFNSNTSQLYPPGCANGTGGGVVWPPVSRIVISNGTNTPSSLAEVDGACAVGAGGNWTAGSCLPTGPINVLAINTVRNAALYCTTPNTLDQSCIVNALANNVTIQLPAGTYNIAAAGFTVSQSGVTLQCLPGAVIQGASSRTSPVATITGANFTSNTCTWDMGNPPTVGGPSFDIDIKSTATGFTFASSVLRNFNDFGLTDEGASNFTVRNSVITMNTSSPSGSNFGIGGGIQVFAPSSPSATASNFLITGNIITGHTALITGSVGGNLQNVVETDNQVYPINGQFGFENGDFSIAQASQTNGMLVSGNTCTITGTSSGQNSHGCFSLISHITGLTLGPNTFNAVGQYIGISLIELGSFATVAPQTINAGQDPSGTQGYNGMTLYAGGTITNPTINGWGANGSAIFFYPFLNSDNLSVTGGSLVADATTNPANSRGIKLQCNQLGVRLQVTSVGAGGAVTGLTSSTGLLTSAGIGGGYSAATGATTTANTGVGTGLTLNTTVNGSGAITSFTINAAGTGYVRGDQVYINSSNANYFGASANNFEMGGGISITGNLLRGFDISDPSGNKCPATGHISGASITGATNSISLGGADVSVQVGSIKSSAIALVTNSTGLPEAFPFGISQPGNTTPANQNMLADSTFKYGSTFWGFHQDLGGAPAMVVASGVGPQGEAGTQVTGTSAGSVIQYHVSQQIQNLLPSTTYAFGASIGFTGSPYTGTPLVGVATSDAGCGNPGPLQAQVVFSGTSGQTKFLHTTFTTNPGQTSVWFCFKMGTVTNVNGNVWTFSEPQFNLGSLINGFVVTDLGSLTTGNQTPPWNGIADTTVTVTGATQNANTCSTGTTVTINGLTTSQVVIPGYSSDPSALTGWGSSGGMQFVIWPSAANTATWKVCNPTASNITFSTVTFNLAAR